MIWFWELSWLWKMLGVALLVSAVCVTAAALIGKAAKIRPGKKVFLLVGILAFVISILVIFFLAQTPALPELPLRPSVSLRRSLWLVDPAAPHLVNGPAPRSL